MSTRQQVGETRDAIIEDDNRQIEAILNANKHRTEPYWIVLFAKPAKGSLDGKYTLVKHVKAYPMRPQSQVGMVVGEVNPTTGEICWETNMPQVPFDWHGLLAVGAQEDNRVVTETTTIPFAYVTR